MPTNPMLPFYAVASMAVADCRPLGIYTLILLWLLSRSVGMTGWLPPGLGLGAPGAEKIHVSSANLGSVKVRFTGLAQTLGQLDDSNRDFRSNCWANLRILGQPCEFQVAGPKDLSRRVHSCGNAATKG